MAVLSSPSAAAFVSPFGQLDDELSKINGGVLHVRGAPDGPAPEPLASGVHRVSVVDVADVVISDIPVPASCRI